MAAGATVTDDLVAFLRARLDEDEAGWKQVAAREDGISEPISHFFGKVLTARMLREVEAKRAILAEHYGPTLSGNCRRCVNSNWEPVTWPCDTARYLAAVYSNHPDYMKEWKP